MIEEKISIKDIHQTFWKCRDFELANLWQRSIFLTAFLVLCFTAYGAVISKIADKLNDVHVLVFMNIVGYLLAIVGSIFSIFWIKMGKGSKAWYEIYESAIGAFETNKKFATDEASIIGGFNYPKLDRYHRHNEMNSSLFSGSAGAYSVSKINIAIGQLFLIVWTLIGITHFVVGSIKALQTHSVCVTAIGMFVGLFLCIAPLYLSSKKRLSSGSINDFYPPPPPK